MNILQLNNEHFVYRKSNEEHSDTGNFNELILLQNFLLKWYFFMKIIYIVHYYYVLKITRPAWAGFKTAEEGIAIIMSYIL